MLIETLEVGSACRAEPDWAGGGVQQWSPSAASGSARQAEPTSAEPAGRKTRKRKAWAPNDDDHAIYHWVKVECKSQYYVADLFGISQPTVSRIVERYEKWQAHADARASGQLDPAERVRAQRALTYLRNERIITSCLRLAGEVEGFEEVTGSVSKAPDGGLVGMREIRCVSRMLDRTGMASRFYRLAFRVGMEQLELVEKEPAIAPAPLSDEEEAEQEAQAAADRAELQATRDRGKQEEKEWEASLSHRAQSAEHAAAQAREEADKLRGELAGVLELLAETQRELKAAEDEVERVRVGEGERDLTPAQSEMEAAERTGTLTPALSQRERETDGVVELKLHNLNHANRPENGTSAGGDCACDTNWPENKNRPNMNHGTLTPALSQRERETDGVVELKLHNLNHANRPENGASAGGDCTCDTNWPENKNRPNVNHGDASPRGEAGDSRSFRPGGGPWDGD